MAKKATLVFGMDLSEFQSAMKSINRQTKSLSDEIGRVTDNAKQALKNAIDIKAPADQIQKLKNDIKQATTHKLNLQMDEAKKRLSDLKAEAIATFASLAGVATPIKTAIDFESSFADVKKVVDFKDNKEIKAFENEILKMSRTIPMSVNELNDIIASGGQLGIDKSELMDFANYLVS